ncbi:MAG: hypothetical protein ACI8QC_000366 [Planctomycetota bacterium]|jgi:hypothetical protein
MQPLLERDDLDGLDDDETIVDPPEIRRAKALLVSLILIVVSTFCVVLLAFFQPQGQLMQTHWDNGYRRSETTYVSASNSAGRIPHGAHRAWHENGALAEEGHYDRGQKTGQWSYFDDQGQPTAAPAE